MGDFQCNVVRVTIEPHPNADAIELARVGGYVSIVRKGQFQTGDLAVYIPEFAVLPEWMLKDMGFWDEMNQKGTLTSSAGNRVKAIKLRGVLSQGLLYPICFEKIDHFGFSSGVGKLDESGEEIPLTFVEGYEIPHPIFAGYIYNPVTHTCAYNPGLNFDAAQLLGVVKWEPVIPTNMAGKVAGGDLEATIGYDFENLKKNPGLFTDGEEVSITEKLHGTLLQVGIIPRRLWEGKPWADKCLDIGDGFKGIVTSKGQGARGLMLDPGDVSNLYVKFAIHLNLWNKLEAIRTHRLGHPNDMPLFIFGEIYGSIQDLKYGHKDGGNTFRAFDIYAGTRNNGFFINQDQFETCCLDAEIDVVPILYRGPFSMDVVSLHTSGPTTQGDPRQIREGIVIKSVNFTRKIAKSISEAYLLRKNATEFQ